MNRKELDAQAERIAEQEARAWGIAEKCYREWQEGEYQLDPRGGWRNERIYLLAKRDEQLTRDKFARHADRRGKTEEDKELTKWLGIASDQAGSASDRIGKIIIDEQMERTGCSRDEATNYLLFAKVRHELPPHLRVQEEDRSLSGVTTKYWKKLRSLIGLAA